MKPCYGWLICGVLALSGCAAPALRSQSPEEFADVLESKTRLVGEVARPFGHTYVKVESVALVTNLDGTGVHDIQTGIGFLDHMLDQLAKHSLIDITVRAKGDLHIDFHHTAEDVGIALGEAVKQALGDKKGIGRYASADLPMETAVNGGKIEAVGANLTIPASYKVITAKVVTPGLIDAHSVVGLNGYLNQPHDQMAIETSSPIQPELRAIDS